MTVTERPPSAPDDVEATDAKDDGEVEVATGPRDGAATGSLAALPVAVDMTGPLAAEVRDHVEAVLGWQPVDEETATLVPPALRLVAPGTEASGGEAPCVLLLPAGTSAAEAARAGARHRPRTTLAWPSERGELAAAVAPLLAAEPTSRVTHDVIRVAAAAGGVGSSTVALALAGLAAWQGAKVLCLLAPGAPAAGVRTVPTGAVRAHDLFSRATPLPGVPGARAVMLAEHGIPTIEPRTAGVDMVVVDAGRGAEGEVLVCRPDRAALERLETTTAGAIVVNGHGAASLRTLQRAAGGRRLVVLPWSARVARAALVGRVPASLPGSWLRKLVPLAPQPPPADA